MNKLVIYFQHEYIRDFILHSFKCESQPVFIDRRKHEKIGEYICSLIKDKTTPVKTPQPANYKFPVEIILPVKKIPKNFLYYTAEDQKNINDITGVYFDIEFSLYYIKGLKHGFHQKNIIESFIVSRKLWGLHFDYEMIKKRTYRSDLKKLNNCTKVMTNKINYMSNKIGEDLKNLDKAMCYSML